MRLDFHLHTTASDGLLSAAELLAAVRRARLEHWAVTDHDTLVNYRRMRSEAGIVAGVEVTAELDGREIHIVGLGVDADHVPFEEFLAGIRGTRECRLDAIIRVIGVDVKIEQLRAGDCESLSRNHLARALVAVGKATGIADAFERFLGDDRQRHYGLPPYPHPKDAIAAIRGAGGVAILAHPGLYGSMDVVERLLAHGFDGLEIKHPRLAPGFARLLEECAQAKHLLASCGSDLHYIGPRQVGEWRLSRDQAAPLLARLQLA